MIVREPESDSVRGRSALVVECLGRRDFAGAASLHDERAILPPPGHVVVAGRREIDMSWRSTGEVLDDIRIETRDVLPLGNDAPHKQGVLAFGPRNAAEGATGKRLVAWTPTPSGWRVTRDIWNLDP